MTSFNAWGRSRLTGKRWIKTKGSPCGLPFLLDYWKVDRLLGGGLVVDHGLLGGCCRFSFQQLAFLHHHHEWIWSVGGGLALEVEAGAIFRNHPNWDLVLEFQSYIRL